MIHDWVLRHRLLAFYGLAFLASWSYWIPVALTGGRLSHVPGLLGPLVAAVTLTAVTEGAAGVGDLAARAVRWRIPLRCYAALAVLVGAALAALALQAVVGADLPTWHELGRMPGLPDAGWLGVFLLVFVINGYGEEVGWRGYAWPELRRHRSLLRAALALTVPWAIWHVPTFWIESGLRGMAPAMLPGLFLGMAAGAVVLGSLYERAGASLLLVALFHALLNMVSGTEGGEGFMAATVSTVIIVWAVHVLRARAEPGGGSVRRAPADRGHPAGTRG